MHDKIKEYIGYFANTTVTGDKNLEVGSLDVNGTIRDVFPVTIGTDMREGKHVDLVCNGEDLPKHFKQHEFDNVISCDTLEHVKYWREFLEGIWHVLKPGGLFLCTLASLRKGRHAYPDDYWRLDEKHILEIFKGQGIINIEPDLGVSFGFVIQKRTETLNLATVYLKPVDKDVPQELLEYKEITDETA